MLSPFEAIFVETAVRQGRSEDVSRCFGRDLGEAAESPRFRRAPSVREEMVEHDFSPRRDATSRWSITTARIRLADDGVQPLFVSDRNRKPAVTDFRNR